MATPPPLPHPLVIGTDASAQLILWLAGRSERPLIVADKRTLAAWPLDRELHRAGMVFDLLVLTGEPLADEVSTDQVTAVLKPNHLPLAVGAGTLTDIVRYAAARQGLAWVSAPTAPSVDGFVSSVAAMTLGGAKISSPATAPIALFASTTVLAEAPQALAAAGAGDILGKFTAVADWKLGALLYDEPFSQERAERTLTLARRVAALTPAIGTGDPAAIEELMLGLIDSGLVMLEQGDSRSASGTEHHIAHVWEMKLIRERRAPVLHGAKVGVASLYAARMWKKLADTTSAEAVAWTRNAARPLPEVETEIVRAGFGASAKALLASRRSFKTWSEKSFRALMDKAAARWDQVRAIAREVPSPQEIEGWLHAAGTPTTPGEIGLEADLDDGLRLGPYLRDRFTAARLLTLLGIDLTGFRY